ncbi:MAG: c-type cytochrome [Isosphaeraceae bacterium]
MTSRSRLVWTACSLALPLTFALAGCGDAFHGGELKYVESEKVSSELKKDEQQAAVRKAMADLFGPDPKHIKVPEGSGLPHGGIRLANFRDDGAGRPKPIKYRHYLPDGTLSDPAVMEGGFGLYRKHCLHCHGVSGAGDGPTAAFLYPRPRDYRRGIFKFTSTATGAKPTRADLKKTIAQGLHGTSMPAFDALMSDYEIEQVLDYMIFLSMRGETELALVDEAAASGELAADAIADVAKSVFNKWRDAENQVVNPPVPKPESTRESVLRGKELFLGLNKTGNKVDCTSCHGPQAVGNGPSFVGQDVFNDVVFGGDPSKIGERLSKYDPKTQELWKNSLDDWGFALRPNNLQRGVYKGGRRPIDLYWRIAKGINGAKMPAHFPTLEPERIWDLVNFVLALPYEPALLDGATLPPAPPAALTPPKVAGR